MTNDAVEMSRTQRKARKALMDDTQSAMQNASARRLVRWVLDRAGVFEPSYTGDNGTFYNEGRRGLGLEIVALMNEVDPHMFVRLMNEGANDIVSLRAANSREDNGNA